MNTSWKLCPLFIIVLTTYIHEGLSVKCWDCSSDVEARCGDPFDNTTLKITNCNPARNLPYVKPTMCKMIRHRVNREWVIIRGCAYSGEPEISGNETVCLTKPESRNTDVQYCTCNHKDGCNAGNMGGF